MKENLNLMDVEYFNQINDIDYNNMETPKKYDSINIVGKYSPNYAEKNEFLSIDSPQESFERFLKDHFQLSKNLDGILLFLMEYPILIKVIYSLADLFTKEFPNDLLKIKIISRINEEKRMGVFVYTNIDGFNASKKIERIEDMIYDEFGNIFENLLISAEFINEF